MAESGVTFVNDSHHLVAVRFRGDGRVWAKREAILKQGHVAAFFFEPEQAYDFEVQGGVEDHLYGRLKSLPSLAMPGSRPTLL